MILLTFTLSDINQPFQPESTALWKTKNIFNLTDIQPNPFKRQKVNYFERNLERT